ncbi:MAG: hypothetical protein LH485_01385 [Sphingomonas bacterium]|nr:hypothetical protein [Sphingomonas bacterium]
MDGEVGLFIADQAEVRHLDHTRDRRFDESAQDSIGPERGDSADMDRGKARAGHHPSLRW